MSGKAGSCEGPKVYPFFRKHRSGGFTWQGCPRLAATPRALTLLRVYDLADGRMSVTEQRAVHPTLVEAFQVIAYAQGLRRWADVENLKKSKG
jgi:hypothetical protein